MGEADEIRVNRAPVLTLWAVVVAERLGHGPDAVVTLGRAVAGSSAIAAGDPSPKGRKREGACEGPRRAPSAWTRASGRRMGTTA